MERPTIDKKTIHQLYAGWISKMIGVRLGAPVEGWTYQEIRDQVGYVDGYIRDYKNFAADDDTNVPVFFIRAMEKYTDAKSVTAQEIAQELLNYAPFEHGFFWWGGYGVSSEHTAYTNLMHGIPAPQSGSALQNGSTVAEQIGGQIFIDVWGLICPGLPEKAAQLARAAASVTHDLNGVYGGIFIACCVSIAYEEKNIKAILERALSFIPQDCEYTRVVRAVMKFYDEAPADWEACYHYIAENFGYDKYPGNCHIIPNIAVMILALLYGEGDFDKTLQIGVMCGWDTDCNVGNIAAIMGVRGGMEAIDIQKWCVPINDLLISSSTLGDQNISDAAQFTDYLLCQMAKITGRELPEPWSSHCLQTASWNHFEYPYSTQSMRTRHNGEVLLENSPETACTGERSLKISNLSAADGEAEIYKKTYYFPSDFSDSRYDPSFSPLLYPGQILHVSLMGKTQGMQGCFFARDSRKGIVAKSPMLTVKADEWGDFNWQIPANTSLSLIDEAGVILQNAGKESGTVYLDDFYWDGSAQYQIDFAQENVEDWRMGKLPSPHFEISQFSRWKGITFLQDACLHITGTDRASAFTGSTTWTDYDVEAEIIPVFGEEHLLNFRVQGAMRSYAFGFSDNGAALYKNDGGYKPLEKKSYSWEPGQSYRLRVALRKNKIQAFINDELIVSYSDEDQPFLSGSIGLTVQNTSHMKCRSIKIDAPDITQ